MGAQKNVVARIMGLEPLLTRSFIVSILGVVGVIINTKVSDGTAEHVINMVFAAFSLLTAVVTRSSVTPTDKVVTYQPNPYLAPGNVVNEMRDDFGGVR